MSNCAVVFVLLSLLYQQCWTTVPRFFRGRPRGGMLGAPNVKHEVKLPKELWYTQQLTHFNDANKATWKQRYWYNSTFWKPGGPVFIMIGGEGEANPVWMVEGMMMKYAQEQGAFALLLEHRFYGQSHPLKDMSVESLQFLNSEQALADLAAFIKAMTIQFKLSESKWICFGGSYPGSLSAWFRLKFPHLVVGAVATSAPVLAQLDFQQYLEVVTASLQTTGATCTQHIGNATMKIQSMLMSDEGRQQLSEKFSLCEPLTDNTNDISNFASITAGNFMGVVQYNKDNRKFEGAIATNITIDVLCTIMNDKSLDDLSKFARVNTLMLDTYGESCLDVNYSDMIKDLRKTSWNSSAAEGGRQWTYQTCTEFGFYQTSDSSKQPFGNLFPLNVSIKQCMDIFGLEFNEAALLTGISGTNTNYGGLHIAGTKIVFPNGSIDPWHALGITSDVSAEEQAIFIEGIGYNYEFSTWNERFYYQWQRLERLAGTAHCANMYPELPSDPPELVQARLKIKEHIVNWLHG